MSEENKRKVVELLKQLLGEDVEGEITQQLETIEQDIIAGKLSAKSNQVLQKVHRSIGVQDGIIKKKKTGLRHIASCGHLIHDLTEIGGKCMIKNCEALVCKECARICQRCLKLLCPKHQKIHNGKVYCPKCKLIMMFGGLF